MPDQPAVPQHCPSARELDDLELLAHGAFGLTGFEGPGGLVTLTVPTEVAAAAQDAGSLELVDPEGLPLARVTVGSTYDAGDRTGITGAGHARSRTTSSARSAGCTSPPPRSPRPTTPAR